MAMPKAISTWCMVLFFLFAGLNHFIPGLTFFPLLTAIFALAAAVFLFIGK